MQMIVPASFWVASGWRRRRQVSMPHIICISALADRETRLRALDAGADDFLQKPVDEAEFRARLRNRLAIQRHCETLHREHQELKTEVDDQVELLGKAIFEINRAHEAVRHFNEEIIFRLCRAAEFRDDETANHVHRVSHYSALIARVVGLDPDRIEALRLASPLHDVGKIGTPDCILRKPGRLDPEEIAVMRRHAEDGHRILHGSDSDLLGLTAEIAWTHHERFDGSGYPRGLKGAEIPLPGRIVAVADVFDALTSRRVYKPAFPKERAVAILREERGKHFDPEIVDGFLSHLSEVLTIMRRFADT